MCELKAVAAVAPATPQVALGIGEVSDPFPIPGIPEPFGRERFESRNWYESPGVAVVTHQLATELPADRKYLLRIRRDRRSPEIECAGRNLDRVGLPFAPESILFPERLDLASMIADRLENEILSVRGPAAATFQRRIGQELHAAKVRTVGADFTDPRIPPAGG